jgi:RNA polymerase sigma factor (sigma-70 family)
MPEGPWRTVIRQLRSIAGGADACDLTDRQLLERFAARQDEAAFAALVRRHGPLVLGVGWRILHHEQDAEDVFQATFLVLAKKAAAQCWHPSVGHWLHEVAYRLASRARVEAARRRAREKQAAEKAAREELPKVAWEQLCAVLDEALRGVPAKYRTPLLLCYLEGQTRDQAARQLGWSLATLKRRLERGRELLRLQLGRHGLAPPAAALAIILAHHTASAAVTAARATQTASAAVSFTAGTAASPGGSTAATLAEGLLRGMAAARVKITAALVLTLGLLTAGAGLLLPRVLAVPQEESHTADPGQPPAQRERERISPPPRPDPPLSQPRRFEGHQGPVNGITFSPDGKLLASAGEDQIIHLWNVANGRITRSFRGHGQGIRQVAFSADQKVLVSAGGNTVRIWDLAVGRELSCFKHDHEVASLAISPDGKLFASAEGKGAVANVNLWSLDAGKQTRRWRSQVDRAGDNGIDLAVAFAPDGKSLAVLGGAGAGPGGQAVHLWDVLTGKEIRRFGACACCLAFSPDGRALATGSSKNTFNLWNEVENRMGRSPLQGPRGAACSLAFSADGRTLASAGRDKTIRLWEAATLKERFLVWRHRDGVTSVAFAPAGRFLAAAGKDGAVLLWNVRSLVSPGPPGQQLTPRELESLWSDLADPDGTRAFQGMWTLIRRPRQAVPFLKERLPPAGKATAAPKEPLNADKLRALRALEVLEQTATPEARRVLQNLAQGAKGAWLTGEAQATLYRPARR